MYIRFKLPNGAGGMAAGHAAHSLKRSIADWADKYQIPYKTKIHKYTLRLCLDRDEDYTFFQLSWNPGTWYRTHYEIVKTES
jgi:hypothetical protein